MQWIAIPEEGFIDFCHEGLYYQNNPGKKAVNSADEVNSKDDS